MTFLPSYIVIHHSATDPDASVADIRHVHKERGMDDIAYHFLIDQSGHISVGRDISKVGAHAKGINHQSIGICCIGDYTTEPPPLPLTESLIALISELRIHFNIQGECIIGHRDVTKLSDQATQTICPGDGIHQLIQRVRERSTPSGAQLQRHAQGEPLNLISPPPIREMYSAEVNILQIEKRQSFLLLVKGIVKNTGRTDWNHPSDDPQHPIRIGLLAYKEVDSTHNVLDEMRFELPDRVVKKGESCLFTFEINQHSLPSGEIHLLVSPVRERDFWFHQQGTVPAIATITLDEPPPRRHVKKPEFILPSDSTQVRILYIGPTLPLYDRDTGGKRLFSILSSFREFGYPVTLVYENPGVIKECDKYISALTKLGIDVLQGPLSYLSQCTPEAFTLCILGWYNCAERYLPIIREVLPNTKVIVDSVDIHWLREARGVATGELTLTKEHLTLNKHKEVNTYAAADEIWVVSEQDRTALLTELPSASTKIVSLMTEVASSTIQSVGRDVLFVGSFNHPPNISAALWGYEICSAFRKKGSPDFIYYIVGANPPEAIKILHDGVKTIVTDFVENLDPYYEKTKVFLAPIKYGAGVKGKITDAAGIGLPILTSPIGNEGIDLIDKREGWICNSTEMFVAALGEAFNPETPLAEIAEAGRQKVLSMTGKESTLPLLKSSAEAIPVVVGIVTYNNCKDLKKCMDSLLAITQFSSWRVCIVSNGCTDETMGYLSDLQINFPNRISVVREENNDYFIRPSNQIVHRYPNADIILLNNDTVITDSRWITELQHAAYTSPIVGAAGCLVLDGEGRISEAGGIIAADGTGMNLCRGLPQGASGAQAFRYTGFVSGCCMYMRRNMISQFGTLDEDLYPMYYEDVEWQFRIHDFGYKTLWTPRTHIIHHEGGSAGTDITSGMKRYQEVNRKKLLTKFAGEILESLNE